MKKFVLIMLFVASIFKISASAQTDYCFENKGLKGSTLIVFAISGNKVTDGEFSFSEYDSQTSSDIFHFKGTKIGKTLAIKFDRSVPKDFSTIKKIVWTLGSNTLKFQMFGKNYETNKWSVYSATYNKCTE